MDNPTNFSDLRFIPAGAGNTHERYMSGPPGAVYPRWRGEHNRLKLADNGIAGLSPLARGTLNCCESKINTGRFIPAGAGNTTLYCPNFRSISVYPRWRGEHTPITEVMTAFCGLSPLARGTPIYNSPPYPGNRFIPAGAGNTVASLFNIADWMVYPRWRGEHSCKRN